MRVMDMDTFPQSYTISLKWLLFSSFHVMYWRQNLILKGGVNGGFQFKRSFGEPNVAASCLQQSGRFSSMPSGSQHAQPAVQYVLCAQPAAQPSQHF